MLRLFPKTGEDLMKMEVQIVSKKLITPSSNPDDHPPNHTLSSLDQLSPPFYFSILFYYAAADDSENGNMNLRGAPILQKLEKSLADTLSVFYPLAGRFNDNNTSINCNDNGVEYLEARVNGQLTNLLLQQPVDAKLLSRFAPLPPMLHSPATPLLFVQASLFECGGLAIGLRASHLVADMHSISLFMRGWANACSSQSVPQIIPSFDLSTVFPPRDDIAAAHVAGRSGPDVVTRRFVCRGKALSSLKAATQEGASRVQVFTALIWRTLVKIDEARQGRSRSSMVFHTFNLRGKTSNLPISENSFGNLWWPVLAHYKETEINMVELVGMVREAIESAKLCVEVNGDDRDVMVLARNVWGEVNEWAKNDDKDKENFLCAFTSWCRMQHYQVDFGWGKPSWVSTEHVPFDGFIIFLDAKDGDGIEAWVSLYENTMLLFEADPDIVGFTTQVMENMNESKKE